MKNVMLDALAVRDAITMTEAIGAVRQGFIGLAGGEFEMPPRTVLGDGRFLSMAVHHRPSATAISKLISLNFERTPAIVGTVVWSEMTGTGRLVVDASAVTALRTGAVTGVATDLLAPRTASRMVLFGAGAQARDQVRAVHAVRPLSSLVVLATRRQRAEELVASMAGELEGVELAVAEQPSAAVKDADIICCATTSRRPLFEESALAAAVHVNAIGAYRPDMRELPCELLATSQVFVDQREPALEESGEIIDAISNGAIEADDLIELGSALTKPMDHLERTVFKSVGVALQDWAIMQLLACKVADLPD